MRLAHFTPHTDSGAAPSRAGVVVGDEMVDLSDPLSGVPAGSAASPHGLLEHWDEMRPLAEAAAKSAARRYALGDVRLLAPVPVPPKFLGIGMNYAAHVAEMGRDAPEYQYWFNKQRTCVVGPGDPIVIPPVSDMVDYEGELGIVIGRRATNVPASKWIDVVAGFLVVNDVSVRDWQLRSPTFTLGKSFDSHGPIGPWIVTPDEVGDPTALSLKTWVNDELRQDSSTDDLIFTCPEMIECLTTVFPLEPGDVLATGTPAGVAMGMQPPRWLAPGDVVRIEIEGIGTLENPVAASED